MRKGVQILIRPMLALMLTLLFSAAWATTITVELRDSDGNLLPDGGTAQLWTVVNNGFVWSEVTNQGDGTFVVSTLEPRLHYKLIYNHGCEIIEEFTSVTTIVFETISIQQQLINSQGNPINDGLICHMEYASGCGFSPGVASNTSIEVLPGNYAFKAVYNNGIQGKDFELTKFSTSIQFQTVSVTTLLTDPDGVIHTGGIVKHNMASGWSDFRDASLPSELLPGIYEFWMYYEHSDEHRYSVDISPLNTVVNFVTTPVLITLLDCNHDLLSGGEFAFFGHKWSPMHETNQHIDMLSHIYHFRVYYDEMLIHETNDVNISGLAIELVFYLENPILKSFVWNDVNGDGMQTGEEDLGIANVQVDIEKPNGTWLMTEYTNANGFATFTDYPTDIPLKLHVISPNGMKFTKSSGPKTNPINSDVDKNGFSPAFQAGSCSEFLSYIDAGLVMNTSNKANLGDMSLNGLYPNPARNAMSYSYILDQDSPVDISIYNIAGAEVMLIEDGLRTSGTNVSEWDVSSLAPGVYIFRAVVGDKVITERFVKTQ